MARPPALTTEVGYVNPSATDPAQWMPGSVPDMWWWELTEQVPELRWPLSLIVFSRMPREDARVWSLLSAIKLPIRRTAWRIDPNGAEDDVVQFIAKDLGLPIKGDGGGDKPGKPKDRQRDRFSWKSHLNEALSHLRYGHSVFEQVYRYDETDGRWHLRKLAPRPQFTISSFDVARDGGLRAIVQDEPSGYPSSLSQTTKRIDISRLVVYRNEPEPGVWIGTSLLRPSYKHWLLKDELIRIEAAAARRNGMGVPVATTNEDDKRNQAKIDEYGRIASRFRGGMSAGAGLPFGAKIELLGVQGNLPDMRSAIEYHDRAIALSGLAHFLNLDGKGGSYALASVQADVFVQSVQALAEDVADITNQHVIEDMVDANFGIDFGAPLIVCDEIGSRQDATAAALNLLVQAGLLDPDDALKAFIRQQLGAPALDPNYEPPALPAAPAPPAEPDPGEPPTNNARKQTKKIPGRIRLDTGQGELF